MSEKVPQGTPTQQGSQCEDLPDPPKVPTIPEQPGCPGKCDCPGPPGGNPQHCFDDLIQAQNIVVKKAERAKAFAQELTAIQDKVVSAQVDYTQGRYAELRKKWKEQDDLIVELIRKLVCAVGCWDCILECLLCQPLVAIRRMEYRLDGPPGEDPKGTGPLTTEVYSLYDQLAWHERKVAQMKARLQRITEVMAAWEKPSSTLGEVLDKNADLIKETQARIASEPAKALYDVFMTLIPRHWAIRPRDQGSKSEWKSRIDAEYVRICDCPATQALAPARQQQQQQHQQQQHPQHQQQQQQQQQAQPGNPCAPGDETVPCLCDDGMPDDCCGPDVGILSLRQRLIGPLPYIVDPALFPDMICCLTTYRLSQASDQLAQAQADCAAAKDEIELVQKQIADRKAAIETAFIAALAGSIDCGEYQPKPLPGSGSQDGTMPPGQILS